MPRPLRRHDPERLYLVTIRTEGALLWMIPSERMTALLGGILARYQEILGIEIFAYTFLGNHHHLLLRAPNSNLDEFGENVNREIAKRVNRLLRKKGKFWSRRYDSQIIIEERDELEALLYVATNPTRHGLIPHPKRYPGLHCYKQLLSEKGIEFEFEHHSEYREGRWWSLAKKRKSTHTLTLSPLPSMNGLPREERVRIISERIEERVKAIALERKEAGKGFLTEEQLFMQKPGATPREVSNSPRPRCYTKSPRLKREYSKLLVGFRAMYREASRRFRLGELTVQFPPFSFKPPLHRRPREERFTELPCLFVA